MNNRKKNAVWGYLWRPEFYTLPGSWWWGRWLKPRTEMRSQLASQKAEKISARKSGPRKVLSWNRENTRSVKESTCLCTLALAPLVPIALAHSRTASLSDNIKTVAKRAHHLIEFCHKQYDPHRRKTSCTLWNTWVSFPAIKIIVNKNYDCWDSTEREEWTGIRPVLQEIGPSYRSLRADTQESVFPCRQTFDSLVA